jgi:hypothetical protein
MAELAPPHVRGSIGGLLSVGAVVGSLTANALVFAWANENDWRYLFGFTFAIGALQVSLFKIVYNLTSVDLFVGSYNCRVTPYCFARQLICALFMEESPRWLAGQDRIPEARQVLFRLRGWPSKIEKSMSIGAKLVQPRNPADKSELYRETEEPGSKGDGAVFRTGDSEERVGIYFSPGPATRIFASKERFSRDDFAANIRLRATVELAQLSTVREQAMVCTFYLRLLYYMGNFGAVC